jgi:hypothetical protein
MRFDDAELHIFQARADLLEKKLESVVVTMTTIHLEIDERLQEVAKANDDTAASAAITASQLQVAEDHVVTLAEQSEKTSSQVEATSGEVKPMANSVNALLKFTTERERHARAQHGLEDHTTFGEFETKGYAVVCAARAPGLQHLAEPLLIAACRIFSPGFPAPTLSAPS